MLKNPLMEKLRAEMSADDKAQIDDSFALSDRIAYLLEKRGISQRALAQKLGKRESEVSKWLSGGHNFTQQTLTKIARAIGEPIYVIPGSKTAIESQIKDHIHIFKSIFSKHVKLWKQGGLHFENYRNAELSTLSVDSTGVICKGHLEVGRSGFVPAVLENKDFRNIERASII